MLRHAPSCARGSRRRPISPARWRGSSSAGAAPATSPPCATAFSPPPALPTSWRSAASSPLNSRRRPTRCAGSIRRWRASSARPWPRSFRTSNASAADRALAIELETFETLAAAVTAAASAIKEAAEALAVLDVAAALAQLAIERHYVRPQIDASLDFIIEGGRHPVVEQALTRDASAFVANDCDLSPPPSAANGRIYLVTGPNMAGKSTYLRQNALIAIMAQMGSFVPARRAKIGAVDRLFSRVGAADDIARGRSTFMVEMVETAAILNQASERALVILDEIGRGTATFDGLSIAWGTIEHLHESNRCRALFATHFHELTALAARLPRLFNATVRVKEWEGEVVFLHEVTAGAADRSYGIAVAKLAGLPPAVIERAKAVLAKLEAEDRASPRGFEDLPLFAATAGPALATARDAAFEALIVALAALHPDEMSPREALEALYALKAKAAEKKG